MDSPSSILSSPSKVLNPLSPERINQQVLPNSPSAVSEVLRAQRKGNRGLSDVQAKVAYLNNLSRGSSPAAGGPPASAGGAAALQRAILGREEAESALSRVSSELSEAQSRERRISERLESLLEELQTAKERRAHERVVFEKEIRKARKEAFRAGSTLVKVQEELKNARSEAKSFKDELVSERHAKEEARQEAFERAYALAGLTEELQLLKGRLRTAEAKSHSAILEAQAQKMNKEHISRMSLAEGDLALLMTPTPRRPKRSAEDPTPSHLPDTTDRSAQSTPPKRQRLSDITPRQEDQRTASLYAQQEIIEGLEEELKHERRLRIDAQEMVEFLQVECRFKRCTCRLLEDKENEARLEEPTKVKDSKPHDDLEACYHNQRVATVNEIIIPEPSYDQQPDVEDNEEGVEEPLIAFSPLTGTFRTIPSPARVSPQKQSRDSISSVHQTTIMANTENELEGQHLVTSPTPKYDSHLQAKSSFPFFQNETYTRDVPSEFHNSPSISEAPWEASEIFNMKRVPLRTEEQSSNRFACIPSTPISREEALAQIRARRGRTSNFKRSASANEAALRSANVGATPIRAERRIPSVQNNTDPRSGSAMRTRRDLSAPVRMLR